MSDENIWVIDDDESIRWVLEKALRNADMQVTTFETADEALEIVRANALPPDAVISDMRMPGSDGLSFLSVFQRSHPTVPVLIMTAHSDHETTVNSFEKGAYEYIPKPFDVYEIVEQTRRACASRLDEAAGQSSSVKPRMSVPTSRTSQHDADTPQEELLGDAPAMQEVFNAIGRLSRSKITVLINGESGTGKELIAQALHRHSPRADYPFVALNMAAIPHNLLESELFGHEKGSFTGADSRRLGRFEQANGGTLFLDEIGDMPAHLQTRLLRVLADGQFFRVGGTTALQVDVRIVAATHQNLEEQVRDKTFREDLFHRLNVIRINAPPLRERREDIPSLLRHFLGKAASELQTPVKQTSKEFENYVSTLPWPGNVRQLENTAHWLTVMAAGDILEIEDLPDTVNQSSLNSNPDASDPQSSDETDWQQSLRSWATFHLANNAEGLLNNTIPEVERILIECALQKTGNRRQEAARLLGWGRNTLTRKIKELELS